eukprot:jgi/Tetstr1/459313/TSEL_004708.t1
MEKSAPDTDDIPATDERAPSQPPRHSAPRPRKSGARKPKPASAALTVEPVKPVVMDGTPADGPARKPDVGDEPAIEDRPALEQPADPAPPVAAAPPAKAELEPEKLLMRISLSAMEMRMMRTEEETEPMTP